jgi:hypothetical protein
MEEISARVCSPPDDQVSPSGKHGAVGQALLVALESPSAQGVRSRLLGNGG